MKTLLLSFFLLVLFFQYSSGQVSINTDGSQPNQAAILDLKSVVRGFLPPRMTTLQIWQIADPPAGLMVYNTDSNQLNLFDGTNWHAIVPGDCVPQPSTSNAGPNQVLESNDTALLQANVPVYGTGHWSVIAGAGGTFSDSASPASLFSGLPVEIYTLRWAITTGCGTSHDDVSIRFMSFDTAVFVSTTGSNSNPGTMALPFLTIQYAITQAVASGKSAVKISAGNFSSTVDLATSVSLYGGYSPVNWFRNPAAFPTHVYGGTQAVRGYNTQNTAIDGINIHSASPAAPGGSSYGLFFTNCTGIRVFNCQVTAAPAAGGTSGSPGQFGFPGYSGLNGQPGCEGGFMFCDDCDQPLGGSGGPSGYGLPGGSGGKGGYGPDPGDPGITGSGTGGGLGGSGGTINSSICTGYRVPGYNANGTDGLDGANGINGSGGMSFGGISASGYIVSHGADGTDGLDGGGGGGGGGGLGDVASCNKYGSGGGGGGSGGQHGTAGMKGTGGGGSFAVWCYNSNITLTFCTLITLNGGNGGAGGTGGPAGIGGAGGEGGPYDSDQGQAGCGGWGGNGGDGGRGGHGGGGGGGPSVGVVRDASSSAGINSVTFNLGQGGTGGISQGQSGQNGLRTAVY